MLRYLGTLSVLLPASHLPMEEFQIESENHVANAAHFASRGADHRRV
jgi:hypothetical protein